jgi:hypothetical protein
VLHPCPYRPRLISADPAPWPGLPCTVGPCVRLWLPFRSPSGDTVAFNFPLSLPNWDGTCPLDFVQLSANLPQKGGLTEFSKLVRSRERTRKQPGMPGTQPRVAPYSQPAAGYSRENAGVRLTERSSLPGPKYSRT